MHTCTVIFLHSETHRTKLIIPRIYSTTVKRNGAGANAAKTKAISDWLTRLTPARRNNLSASLLRNVFVLTRCFPERLKNANLSFRKQLQNDLKAIRAGQTWSGVEKKRHH